METMTGILMILVFTLTAVVGGILAWQRGRRRCVRCGTTIALVYPYCPWCSQMQFSKTARPQTSASPPRARASLPTGERLALLVHAKKRKTQGKDAPTVRSTRADAGTVVLPASRQGSRIVPEPMTGQTTVGTARKSLACCTKCGQRIEGLEDFCGYCGWPQKEGNIPQKERT